MKLLEMILFLDFWVPVLIGTAILLVIFGAIAVFGWKATANMLKLKDDFHV